MTTSASMERATRFHALANPLVPIRGVVGADTVAWQFPARHELLLPELDDRLYRVLIELQMATHHTLSQDVMGAWCQPAFIGLGWPRPPDGDDWSAGFGVAASFAQPRCELRYPAAWLERAPQLANVITAAQTSRECARLLATLDGGASLARRVYRELMHTPGRFPGIESIAATLGMTGRTLRRRLQAEGTSYADMLTRVRRALAEDYLRGTRMSVDDIAGFPGVVQIYRALRKAHGDQLGPPLLVGGEIRLGLCPSADLAPRSAEAIHASFICTAQELERNANREQPLPLGKVLSDAAAAKVLDAVSTATRKAGTQLFLRTEDSEFVVPTLAPEHFLEARQDEQVQRTDTFQVVGLRRGWRCEPHGLWVGENALPVVLPANDPRWAWEQIHDVLEQPTFLVGTLVRESRSSPWMPGEPSRLERQPQLAVASS